MPHITSSSLRPGGELSQLPSPLCDPIDAHRRLRGPYTAAGTLLRAVVPDALDRCAHLVRAHEVEILSMAPELREMVGVTRETLTSLAIPVEHTRFYSRMRTQRLAHGVTEFLRDYVRVLGAPRSVIIDRAEQADQTDRELVSILMRRLDRAELTLVIRAGEADAPSAGAGIQTPDGDVDDAGLDDHGDAATLARRYVESECTSTDPALRAAYDRLSEEGRAALHDARATALENIAEPSLKLGAIPFHRERGLDRERAVAALLHGVDYCVDMGYYEAAVEFGVRGRALVEAATDLDAWWRFTTRMTMALAALGRPEEAEAIFDEARSLTDSAVAHQQAAYATAMLYTRHHDGKRKDHEKALAWINQAIAFATQIADPRRRAFETVFQLNGKALIENHLGRPLEALRLVSGGIERLDAELDPGAHRLHRSVLRYNRAQVYAGLGRTQEAVQEYQAVIEEDPNYPEYHFDLGNILRRAGRDEEAIEQYEIAMRLSPPFPELYYNRADTRAALGDLDGAIADFRHVIELDPDYVDASVNLAGLLADLGRTVAAREVADAALPVGSSHPHVDCVVARLALDDGDRQTARERITRALTADPELAEAWALRGTLAFIDGDLAEAAAAFEHSAQLRPDAAVLFNLGAAREQADRREEALAAYASALELAPEDEDVLTAMARCVNA